jgi:hypothetical protein
LASRHAPPRRAVDRSAVRKDIRRSNRVGPTEVIKVQFK